MTKSIVEFCGNTTFYANTVDSVGGALYLRPSSQIMLHTNAHLKFIENTGRQVTHKYVAMYHSMYYTKCDSFI